MGTQEYVSVLMVVLSLLIGVDSRIVSESKESRTRCKIYDQTTNTVSSQYCDSLPENLPGGDKDEEDRHQEFFCHAVWSNTSDPGVAGGWRVRLLQQQCTNNLGNAHDSCRERAECVETGAGRAGQRDRGQVGNRTSVTRIYHCCCRGDDCNEEFTWRQDQVTRNQTEVPLVQAAPPTLSIYILLYTLVPVLVLSVIGGAVFYVYHQRKHASFGHLSSLDDTGLVSPPTPTPTLACRPVQLLEIKARGRFGAVWKGQLNKDMVAVKIFPLQDKQSWFAEQEIYNLPQMSHENILKFLGVEKRGENLQMEFWLVSEFHERGSLCDFLKSNILTWEEMTRVAMSMARGLAHLHGEIPSNKGSDVKPAIAHRDFKSKNVLIKSDMTACIGDFGLALVFRPNEVVGDTHGQVGTRRYMAPEVLEGAINFSRDAFLRIDLYACGLVLWEIMTRCSLLEIPADYKLPFEAESTQHPSLEEISDLVVNRKVRPELKKAWRQHPGLSILCDTVEECWDHDAEARLSASCVVERLSLMRQVMAENSTEHININNQINLATVPVTETMRLIPLNGSVSSNFDDSSSFG